MSFKSNIDAQIRGFYFAESGDDASSGETFEVPKKTIQAAIDAAFALDPIPQAGNIALVSVAQGGSFAEGFILQDWIQFNAEDVTIETSQAIAAVLGSFLSARVAGVTNSQDSSIVFQIDGKEAIGLEALFMAVAGTSSIGLNITGAVDDLFITLSRVLVVGDNSTGIDITSTTNTPIDININTVSMPANNAIFMRYAPVNTSDNCTVDVSTVSGDNATGFIVDNGILIVQAALIDAPTFAVINNAAQFTIRSQAIFGSLELNDTSACTIKPVAFYVGNMTVNDTATLFCDAQILFGNLTMGAAANGIVSVGFLTGNVDVEGLLFLEIESLIGDITVASGATLNCDIASHVGTLTNNGTINGIINGEPFGNYRQKPFQQVVLRASDFTLQSPVGLDNPLQLTFGPAQFGPSDPVQLDALGNVQINQTDQYNLFFILQYGRVGAGQASVLFFRVLIDGNQFGPSRYGEIDNADSKFPVEFSAPFDLASGQVLTIEIWRDSTGFDAGSLFPKIPTLAGALAAPSATLLLTSNRLVQPVEEDQPPVTDGLVGLYNELGIVGSTPVTAWQNSVVGLPDLDVVVGTAANLTRITALGHDVVNASGSVSIESTAGSLISSPATVFMVAQFNAASPSDNQVLMDARSSLTDRMMIQSRNASSDRFTIFQGAALITLDLADTYDTSPHIWTMQYNGDSTTTLTVAGVGTKTGDAGPDDWDFGMLFGDTTGAESSDAYIATLLVFDRKLSASEVSQMEAFLADEYGL